MSDENKQKHPPPGQKAKPPPKGVKPRPEKEPGDGNDGGEPPAGGGSIRPGGPEQEN